MLFLVLELIYKSSQESGKDSQGKKRYHIEGLLEAAIDCEPQYLIRLVQVEFDILTIHLVLVCFFT